MRVGVLAACVVIAVGVAGCTSTTSGTPTAAPTTRRVTPTSGSPTVSSSAPTSPSPTVPTSGPNVRPGEKPPKLPAIAKTHTRAGAATFAAFWFKTWDWAYATTDASLMRKYYSKSCSDCALVASGFAKAQRRGEHYRGGRLFLLDTRIVDSDKRHGAQYAVDVTEGQTPLKVVASSGKVIERDNRVDHITFRMYLKWVRDAWTIVYKAHVV